MEKLAPRPSSPVKPETPNSSSRSLEPSTITISSSSSKDNQPFSVDKKAKASSPAKRKSLPVSFSFHDNNATPNLTEKESSDYALLSKEPLKLQKPSSIDVDEHPLLANLKLDGKESGAYMLCKFADDVLGHRARQIFREKASSMKGQNGIYYYLKDLIKKFRLDENDNTPKNKKQLAKQQSQQHSKDQLASPKHNPNHANVATLAHMNASVKKILLDTSLTLEEYQFRKLMASDPAFECLVAEEDTSVLFQRILNHPTKTALSLLDFVHFCLLDRLQL
jgi:hypothetical protein